jgi:PPOX class probable F420-dependent enzyme
VELETAMEFARTQTQSVLVTIRRNGRPQLSNVAHLVSDDGTVRVSISAERAKYHNARREPWAAVHVTRADFWAYAVIEGDVGLSPVSAAADDDTVDQLVEYYRAIRGEHPDWDDYRRAMVAEMRVLMRITPTHAYGMLP